MYDSEKIFFYSNWFNIRSEIIFLLQCLSLNSSPLRKWWLFYRCLTVTRRYADDDAAMSFHSFIDIIQNQNHLLLRKNKLHIRYTGHSILIKCIHCKYMAFTYLYTVFNCKYMEFECKYIAFNCKLQIKENESERRKDIELL